MKTIGDKYIADIGKFLIKNNSEYKLSISFAELDPSDIIEEEEFDLSTIKDIPYGKITINNKFVIQRSPNIKKDLIESIWSHDEQIAILLNKDDSEKDIDYYSFMQQWRSWMGGLVKLINNSQ